MYHLLLVIVIIFICLPCHRAQEIRILDSYNYSPILSTGTGFDEKIPKQSRLRQLETRSGVIETSRETEQTNSYVEDSLTRNLNSFEDLKGYIVETNEADGGLKTITGVRESYDRSVSDGLASKKEYVGTFKDSIEHFDDDVSEFHSTRAKEKARFRRSMANFKGRIRRETHPSSPCPKVFSYEGMGSDNGKWYGVIILTNDETLNGVKIEVRLDKIANLLESSLGQVSSSDNIIYTIWSSRTKLEPGSSLSVRITVKYNENGNQPPRIQLIKLNGKQICPISQGGVVILPVSPGGSSRPTQTTAVTPSVSVTSVIPTPSQPNSQPGNTELVDGEPCGRIDIQPLPFITHGQPTARGQWPWHAALYLSQGNGLSYICGGSLIGKSTILTAAHCVTKRNTVRPVNIDDLVVYLGKYDRKLWTEEDVQSRQIKEMHINPEYSYKTLKSDIAILILSSPVVFTMYVKPICLWDRNRPQLGEVEGKEGVVVGWGYNEEGELTEELMMAKMPVVSRNSCIFSFPDVFSTTISGKSFCAAFKNGSGVCFGDSGGGMVFPKSDVSSDEQATWSLRGIVSFGLSKKDRKECITEHNAVFADVAQFYEWIDLYRSK